jgi:hypothetical protein
MALMVGDPVDRVHLDLADEASVGRRRRYGTLLGRHVASMLGKTGLVRL